MPPTTEIEVAVTKRRKGNGILSHFLNNTDYPEQSVPLLFFFCKDIFVYLVSRISSRNNLPYRIKKGNSPSKFMVNSNVVNCVKSFYSQTPVYVIDSAIAVNEIIKLRLLCGHVKFIGLDCEWVNLKRKGTRENHEYCHVALLQLATPNECLLVRLSKMNGVIPDALKELLEDRHVLKFGVAILEDAKRMRKMGVTLRGAVDLRHAVQRCQRSSDVIQHQERLGLNALASSILGIKLDKSLAIRCSDWESDCLTDKQIAYASNDAIVSLQIFLALVLGKIANKNESYNRQDFNFNTVEKLFICQPSDSGSTIFSTDFKRYLFNQERYKILGFIIEPDITHIVDFSDDFTKQAMSVCQGLIDLAFKEKHKGNKLKMTSSQSSKICEGKLTKIKDATISVRAQPFYQNCYIIAPDGTTLFTCDKRKAEWYVRKGLGVIDKEEPYTVRLAYSTNVPSMSERDYYVTEKENRCVVCGRDDQYMRKMIIPRDYRRHFPAELKNYISRSHDILLLCPPCHRMSSSHDEDLRQEIAKQYNVPVSQATDEATSLKVKSAARALLNSSDKLPPERKRELEKVLETHENVKTEELDNSRLQQIIDKKMRGNCNSESYGAKVIKKVVDEGQLRDFVKMWREHFLETMKPKFLPPLWSSEHNLNVEKRVKRNLEKKAAVSEFRS